MEGVNEYCKKNISAANTNEFLKKEIEYIMERNASEKFLRALLTRALILEDVFRST